MFTGIVEELGTVRDLRTVGGAASLTVDCDAVLDGTAVGDSLAVNGCCLTVTELHQGPRGFTADLMGETLARTALGRVAPGARVNLERAVALGGRLDGHLVQGHVDAVADVTEVADHGEWTWMAFSLPPAVAPYVAEKGSIAVDGVSLTVAAVDERSFAVGLIPHTLAVTALGRRRPGDAVNLEADVVAKYVERLLTHRQEGA
jgi:riboflavin synthase